MTTPNWRRWCVYFFTSPTGTHVDLISGPEVEDEEIELIELAAYEELQVKFNRVFYDCDKAREDRDKFANERDALQAEVERLKPSTIAATPVMLAAINNVQESWDGILKENVKLSAENDLLTQKSISNEVVLYDLRQKHDVDVSGLIERIKLREHQLEQAKKAFAYGCYCDSYGGTCPVCKIRKDIEEMVR